MDLFFLLAAQAIKKLKFEALLSAYLVTLLAWLGWICLQMYQTEFVAKEVFQGSPDQTSPLNKACSAKQNGWEMLVAGHVMLVI